MDLSLQSIVDSLGAGAGVPFAVTLAGGKQYRTGAGEPAFTLVFRTDRALMATFARGHLGLMESYFDQEVDVGGDLGTAMAAAMRSGFDLRFDPLNSVENNLMEWRTANRDATQAKVNARTHYGLGEPFYRLWLDEPLNDVHLRLLARRLRQPGAGPARQDRPRVPASSGSPRASASSTSAAASAASCSGPWKPLARLARASTPPPSRRSGWTPRSARRGLREQLRVREADFREVDRQYDKVVSIGVLEHAGRDQLRRGDQALTPTS